MSGITSKLTIIFFAVITLLISLVSDIIVDKLLFHVDNDIGSFIKTIEYEIFWLILFIPIISIIISRWLALKITVPLRKLCYSVDAVAKGEYNERVNIKGGGEIESLSDSFNRMVENIEKQIHLRQKLLADITHELKTPLTVIIGNIEGMLDGVISNNEEQLLSIHDEILRLNRLIKDLSDISLAEAGELCLEKTKINLADIVNRALNMLAPLFSEKEIKIEKSIILEGSNIMGEATRINQIVYNLLTNAIRYTANSGLVTVFCYIEGKSDKSWVVLTISDTGEGIPKSDIPFIFDHFYRVDKSRNRNTGGSGIGLAIVKRLVELHEGFIEVNSVIGSGSTFKVYFPPIAKAQISS